MCVGGGLKPFFRSSVHSSFLAHHLASISAAVVYADAQELCTAGKVTSHGLTIGLAP